MKKTVVYAAITAVLLFTLSSCGIFNSGSGSTGGGGLNLFSIEQDKELGAQVAAEIESDKVQFPLLDSLSNSEVYKYIYKIRATILNSGKVENKDNFAWQMKIIHDDSTINAFCTPGGYIYVYTGLIKYLDSEDQLAGVMSHEIAHADLRHSTRQMTKLYGVNMLMNVVLGTDQESIKQITSQLIGLKFSRTHETEADAGSVNYLCPTPYNAAGGAGFFEKIVADGGGGTPEFLSTHPSPDNRIEHFNAKKIELGCIGTQTYQTEYDRIKKLIPASK
jgi:predicted Zn-dependent protease